MISGTTPVSSSAGELGGIDGERDRSPVGGGEVGARTRSPIGGAVGGRPPPIGGAVGGRLDTGLGGGTDGDRERSALGMGGGSVGCLRRGVSASETMLLATLDGVAIGALGLGIDTTTGMPRLFVGGMSTTIGVVRGVGIVGGFGGIGDRGGDGIAITGRGGGIATTGRGGGDGMRGGAILAAGDACSVGSCTSSSSSNSIAATSVRARFDDGTGSTLS
jgi:hypothetical protein